MLAKLIAVVAAILAATIFAVLVIQPAESRPRKPRPTPTPTVTATPTSTITVSPTPTITPTPTYTSPSPSPSVTPLWGGGYETANLSEFQNAPWNFVNTAAVVDSTIAYSGTYSGKYQIVGGDSRCETVPNFRPIVEGDDLYFSLSTYLNPGFPVNTGWQVLYQWKNDGTGSPPLELTVRENSSVFRVDGGWGHPSGPRLSGIDAGPVITGQWIRWIFHIRFSSDPTVGYVDVWRDGVNIVSGFHPTGGTLYPGLNSYVKNGYYRNTSITTTGILWQDSLKIGTSFESVL